MVEIDIPPIIYQDTNGNEVEETDVEVGYDVTIGTEKFMIINKTDSKITAMPYYNITLEDTPIQSSGADVIAFSDLDYWWTGTNEDINMTEKDEYGFYKNAVQQYIEAYASTLASKGATNVTTRIARYSEVSRLDTATNSKNVPLLNPGQIGTFWVGTSSSFDASSVYCIERHGILMWDGYARSYNYEGPRCSSGYRY